MSIPFTQENQVIYRGTGQFSKSFGQGLYCRFSKDLAREYGQINKYEMDFTGLKILDLRQENIMEWITIVSFCRDISVRDCVFTFNEFDLSAYDVVIGYRSDNSYLTALKQCMSGNITRNILNNILKRDDRNIEICLRTEKAKSRLVFKKVISKENAKVIDDIQTRKLLKVSDSYIFELTKILSEYFACSLECGKSYDEAYNILIDSGVYIKLKGRFIAGVTGSDLYEMCTGKYYKNFRIDHHDFWLSNLISRYIVDNGYDLRVFRNKGISMGDLLVKQDMLIN